jgi:hypothetical protein
VPVDVSSRASVVGAVEGFLRWYDVTDPTLPNDAAFLAQLTRIRTQLHAAKQAAVAERIRDIVAQGEKAAVFCAFSAGNERHRKEWAEICVTITCSDSAGARQAAVDRFQDDPEVKVAPCDIIAGGVAMVVSEELCLRRS